MRTQRFLTLAGAGLAALFLSATALSAKTFVYCSEGSPENFTPALNTTGTSFDAARPVFSQLVRFKRGTTESHCRSCGEMGRIGGRQGQITFHLRKGVKWHSGVNGFTPTRDFNADDVLWSFNRQWKPDHPYAKVSGGKYDYFSDMDMPKLLASIEKKDDYTVVFTLTEPECADARQSRHGLRIDPIRRIRRLPHEEGHARAVRPDPGRHRAVPIRRLSEGCGDPLQGQSELLCGQGQDRRPRLCDHARSDLASCQAQDGRVQLHAPIRVRRISPKSRTTRAWR